MDSGRPEFAKLDTIADEDNVWLVLVFHGVDGVGWEPRTSADLTEYFAYLKSKEDALWIATFQDVGKYIVVYRRQANGTWRAVSDIFNSDQ